MYGTHLALLNVAADIEEVGRLTAVQLDDVHGGHGQPSTVHQATDVPVHLHRGPIIWINIHEKLFLKLESIQLSVYLQGKNAKNISWKSWNLVGGKIKKRALNRNTALLAGLRICITFMRIRVRLLIKEIRICNH
jgi:hypothetical protein